MKALHIKVYGKVQGVFFRKYARQAAMALQLKGWVRNMSDGSVEIMVEGDSERLEQFSGWCYQGSPESLVERVEKTEAEIKYFTSFEVLNTGLHP
jgi:acylphosphatase